MLLHSFLCACGARFSPSCTSLGSAASCVRGGSCLQLVAAWERRILSRRPRTLERRTAKATSQHLPLYSFLRFPPGPLGNSSAARSCRPCMFVALSRLSSATKRIRVGTSLHGGQCTLILPTVIDVPSSIAPYDSDRPKLIERRGVEATSDPSSRWAARLPLRLEPTTATQASERGRPRARAMAATEDEALELSPQDLLRGYEGINACGAYPSQRPRLLREGADALTTLYCSSHGSLRQATLPRDCRSVQHASRVDADDAVRLRLSATSLVSLADRAVTFCYPALPSSADLRRLATASSRPRRRSAARSG